MARPKLSIICETRGCQEGNLQRQLRQAQEDRDILIQRLWLTKWMWGVTLKAFDDAIAERDAAIKRAEAAETLVGRLAVSPPPRPSERSIGVRKADRSARRAAMPDTHTTEGREELRRLLALAKFKVRTLDRNREKLVDLMPGYRRALDGLDIAQEIMRGRQVIEWLKSREALTLLERDARVWRSWRIAGDKATWAALAKWDNWQGG